MMKLSKTQIRSAAKTAARAPVVIVPASRPPRVRTAPCSAAATHNANSQMSDADEKAMFCFQCEQTAHGTGCTTVGVCGKTPDVAMMQDLLCYMLQGLGAWAVYAKSQLQMDTSVADSFVKDAMFSTLTNVNFNPDRFHEYLYTAQRVRDDIVRAVSQRDLPGPTALTLPWFDRNVNPINFVLPTGLSNDDLVDLGKQVSLEHRRHVVEPTLLGLQEMLRYGLMGICAYAHHAEVFGKVDAKADAFLMEVLAFYTTNECGDINQVLDMLMKIGQVNFRVMEILEQGSTETFGNPVPTPVPVTPKAGKAILISGHDFLDLEALLKQTEGTGISVYTHGEMLPAHGYPGLKKYSHLYGNYGGAWYAQKKDFAEFPGPIIMTSNCIIEPPNTYADRIYTTGPVGIVKGHHLPTRDFSAVIQKAQEFPGFTYEPETPKMITTGFGKNAVLGAADKVVESFKNGDLKHIFLLGGCDGFESSRSYYTDVAMGAPNESMVLTLGCAKFRFNHQEFGSLPNGLPRLLDMGQCNDTYAAVMVALELAKAFDTDVNSLPLSLDIAWFEQKAIIVLLTLLSLGVKNIRVGPNLPAFITPECLNVLVEKFDMKVPDLKHPKDDLQRMLQGA